MNNELTMRPIGHVRSTRREITDDNWDTENVYVELDSNEFSGEALFGLQIFSHVEILFYMDKVDPNKVERTARHPRNNPDWPKVGIFAQRGKNRPNQIGATICRILSVDALKLSLEGLDAVDGTPVLDIKPWVMEFSPRGTVFQPPWITELMRGYWGKAQIESIRLGQAIPQLPSGDIEKTATFFVERLGFEIVSKYLSNKFLIVKRGAAEIHFWQTVTDEEARQLGRESSCYIRVENIEELFKEIKYRGAVFRYELTRQPWGMNEMQIDDPYLNAIRFGAQIKSEKRPSE